jgi:hypothetical protein
MPGLTIPTRTSSRGKVHEKEEWGEDGGGAKEQGGRRGEGRKQRRNAAGRKQAHLTPQPTTTTTTSTTAQPQYPSLAAPKFSPDGGKICSIHTDNTHPLNFGHTAPADMPVQHILIFFIGGTQDGQMETGNFIYTCKVLHRVLYPRRTVNGNQKKKKKVACPMNPFFVVLMSRDLSFEYKNNTSTGTILNTIRCVDKAINTV